MKIYIAMEFRIFKNVTFNLKLCDVLDINKKKDSHLLKQFFFLIYLNIVCYSFISSFVF